ARVRAPPGPRARRLGGSRHRLRGGRGAHRADQPGQLRRGPPRGHPPPGRSARRLVGRGVITHRYVAKLKPGTLHARVADWLQAIRGLVIPGMSELKAGVDLALREGNDDVAITADFDNVESWRRY